MIPAERTEGPQSNRPLDLTQVEKVFRPAPLQYVKAAGQSLPADERRSGRTLHDGRFAPLAKFHGEFSTAGRPTLQQDTAQLVATPILSNGLSLYAPKP